MIHNPGVNADLLDNGVRFIMDTDGTQLIPWDEIGGDDVVIVPAFGTTIEIESILEEKGIEVQNYNTTCPFVEKVWKRSSKLGDDDFTIIIHGKPKHEETRATFSHSKANAPSLVIRNIDEASILGEFITGKRELSEFDKHFEGRYSSSFDPSKHLDRIGVVNQTTMLATETQEIADYLKARIVDVHGEASYKDHFADTRDTLCYATNDNQSATLGLLEEDADIALVVGGYNSSNTSHLVELLEGKFPTYFISSESEIEDNGSVNHFIYEDKKKVRSEDIIKSDLKRVIITSGASCPDATVDRVIQKVLSFYEGVKENEETITEFEASLTDL